MCVILSSVHCREAQLANLDTEYPLRVSVRTRQTKRQWPITTTKNQSTGVSETSRRAHVVRPGHRPKVTPEDQWGVTRFGATRRFGQVVVQDRHLSGGMQVPGPYLTC